jgi:peptidoglycan/xylan/chitin deacetylase (PgdA/CDA1 family)
MRIPITMIHGFDPNFETWMSTAAEMGFQSVSYDDLSAWRFGEGAPLPVRPIMIDFDHPASSIRYGCFEMLNRYGFRGNLFINTGHLDDLYSQPIPPPAERETMTWEEIGELLAAGWHLGAHTVTHPNLSELALKDPTGDKLRWELEHCDEALEKHLGVKPRDFAFTGTSWSGLAEQEVKKRYRFGRLWIVGSEYQADGKTIRYADLVGVPGEDEQDGGPPYAARYITERSDPYRLPSMELQRLLAEPAAFRRYLEMALEP